MNFWKKTEFISDFGLKSDISREMASRNPWIQKFLVNTNEFLENVNVEDKERRIQKYYQK